ncbi:MAG: hypothetical protein AABY22_06695, partial [Nanoarchaeota archaeon]
MTNQEILTKIIAKAKKNGWKMRGCQDVVVKVKRYEDLAKKLEVKIEDLPPTETIYFISSKNKGSKKKEVDLYNLIFSHDFAIAIFGAEDKWDTTPCTCPSEDCPFGGLDVHYTWCRTLQAARGYKVHLEKMVVAARPLEY